MSAVVVGVLSAGSGALAHPQARAPGATEAEPHPAEDEAVDFVVVPPQPARRAAGLARTIYLNRCAGNCVVGTGKNDASTDHSTIAKRQGRLAEFPFGEVAWNSMVECVRRGYDQYDVAVTTEEPAAGESYVEVMVAGSPEDIGFPPDTLGIAPLSSDCSPQRNVLAFAFTWPHRFAPITELCATVVHEAGHAFGLDHALQCRDPMSYLTSCGDRLFFNVESKCGEFRKSRNCRCGDTQNSHVKLLNTLGPSGRPPAVGEVVLDDLREWDGSLIMGKLFESRWVRSVELWINGFRWERQPHTALSDFRFAAPPVPSGILDVEVRVVNDLGGVSRDSFTVTNGAPCQNSEACAAPSTCQEGRCMYPAPTGPVGMVCSESSDCASWECFGFAGQKRCSQVCSPGLVARGDCPSDHTCVSTDDPHPGMCWPTAELPDSGGCAAGRAPGLPAAAFALWAVLGLAPRRRRKG